MSASLKQCTVDGATDEGRSLLKETNYANLCSRHVDGDRQTKLQPSGGHFWSFLHMAIEAQNCLQESVKTYLHPVCQLQAPRKRDVSWASREEAQSKMRVLKRKGRDIGFTIKLLVPRCSGRSVSLAIGGIFMKKLAATCAVGCA